MTDGKWGIWPVLRRGMPAHTFDSSEEAHAYFERHYEQKTWVATIAPIPPPCQHMRCEAGSRRCLDCGVHVPY